MKQNVNSLSSVLVTTDPALRNALSYLFSVILKHSFEIIDSSEDGYDEVALSLAPQVLFVHDGADPDAALALIETAKRQGKSVVIALHDGASHFGAQAFLAGADDVVQWPCSLHELALRMFSRLGLDPKENAAAVIDANWETEAYIAAQAGLTTAEAQVMRVLFSHDGQIVSRDDLSFAVDDRPWRYGDRKFDVHVAKIRKKLTDAFGGRMSVATVRSLGYCLSTHDAELFR